MGFNTLLAVDDPGALPLVRQPGSDGFRLDSSALFQVRLALSLSPSPSHFPSRALSLPLSLSLSRSLSLLLQDVSFCSKFVFFGRNGAVGSCSKFVFFGRNGAVGTNQELTRMRRELGTLLQDRASGALVWAQHTNFILLKSREACGGKQADALFALS